MYCLFNYLLVLGEEIQIMLNLEFENLNYCMKKQLHLNPSLNFTKHRFRLPGLKVVM